MFLVMFVFVVLFVWLGEVVLCLGVECEECEEDVGL